MTGLGEIDLGTANHCLLWLDIDTESVFGFRPPVPQRRPDHSLQLHDPKVIRRYNNFVRSERRPLHMPSIVVSLELNATQGSLSPLKAIEYDRVAGIDLDIRQRAKKQCRRFYSGAVPYSNVTAIQFIGGVFKKSIIFLDGNVNRR